MQLYGLIKTFVLLFFFSLFFFPFYVDAASIIVTVTMFVALVSHLSLSFLVFSNSSGWKHFCWYLPYHLVVVLIRCRKSLVI